MTDPNLRQVKSALEQLSEDPRAQHLAFERQIELNSRERYLEIAREKAEAEGHAKGLSEGLEEGRSEGLAEGRSEGQAKGRAALAETIELLCRGARVELTVDRRAVLDRASLDDLGRIVGSLALQRSWPEE